MTSAASPSFSYVPRSSCCWNTPRGDFWQFIQTRDNWQILSLRILGGERGVFGSIPDSVIVLWGQYFSNVENEADLIRNVHANCLKVFAEVHNDVQRMIRENAIKAEEIVFEEKEREF